jgi:hypothetical protein
MKRITRTPKVDEALRRGFGAEADLSGLAVYEMIAANGNPIRKKSGIYAEARITTETLGEMAQLVNQESRQLILIHNDNMMPVGRVFEGRLNNGAFHALFAVNEKTQAAICSDLDAGIIDQVSVSILSKALLCSQCGWDYYSEAATYDNIWGCVCGNGHQIGENGVHARLVGVDAFTEVSLCGMGAVPGARVINPSASAFSNSSPRDMALRASADGPRKHLVLHASVEQPKDTKSMDLAAAMLRIEALAAGEATAKAATAALQAASDAAAALAATTIADLTTKLTEATASLSVAAPAVADVAALRAAVEENARRALVATGVQTPTLATDVPGLIAQMSEAQAKLTAALPADGARSKSAAQLAAEANAARSNRAFTA